MEEEWLNRVRYQKWQYRWPNLWGEQSMMSQWRHPEGMRGLLLCPQASHNWKQTLHVLSTELQISKWAKKIKVQFVIGTFGWLNFDFLLSNSLFHLLFLVKTQVHRRLSNLWTLASEYNSTPPPPPQFLSISVKCSGIPLREEEYETMHHL